MYPGHVLLSNPARRQAKGIEADAAGGTITSHGGLLLAGLAERSLDLFARVAACFDDARNRALVVHEVRTLVGQRILGLLTGLDDLNDHRRVRPRILWPERCWGAWRADARTANPWRARAR